VLKGFQGDPVASPIGWTDGTATAGNNVVVGENLAGTQFISPTPTQGVNGGFSFSLQLGPAFFPLNCADAAVTNLFYWMNRAHDLHYQYGFDEQSGNFQMSNFGRGGVGADPIFAYAHFGAQLLGRGEFENSFLSIEGTDDDGVQGEVAMFMSAGSGASNARSPMARTIRRLWCTSIRTKSAPASHGRYTPRFRARPWGRHGAISTLSNTPLPAALRSMAFTRLRSISCELESTEIIGVG
jgi:hypothetical protein